jgi:predicted RNA-binding protein with RPS1 domain
VGDIVEGTISGIVNFGVFMKIDIEGNESGRLVQYQNLIGN